MRARQLSADKDYYSMLEVSPAASEDVVNAAHRTLMKRFHPDLATSERQRLSYEDRAKDINEARDVLMDPSLRSEYDRRRMDYLGRSTVPPVFTPSAATQPPISSVSNVPTGVPAAAKPPLAKSRLHAAGVVVGSLLAGWAIVWTVLFVAYLLLKASLHVG